METTRLSSKGQVIIPKVFRSTLHWEAGQELTVIDTGDGLLIKPKAAFTSSDLSEVAGLFKGKVEPRTDAEIEVGLLEDVRRQWRDSN